MIINQTTYNTKPTSDKRIELKDYLDEMNNRYNAYRSEWEILDEQYRAEEQRWKEETYRGWRDLSGKMTAQREHKEKIAAFITEFNNLQGKAEQELNKVVAEADNVFGKYSRATGDKLDLQTVELLKSGILSDYELKALSDDFKGNIAMLRLIGKYVGERAKTTNDGHISNELEALAYELKNAKFEYRKPLENYVSMAVDALSKDPIKSKSCHKALNETTYPTAVENAKDIFLTVSDDEKTENVKNE